MGERKDAGRRKTPQDSMTVAEERPPGDEPLEGGGAGGDLAREVGARDQRKRAFERPAGATRVEGRHKRKKG